MTPSSHNFITSKLGMKRSFNCPDLSSITDSVVDSDDDAAAAADAGLDAEYDYYQQKPAKRRRADSNASSCSAVCYCCCWEEEEEDNNRTSCTESWFLPTSTSSSTTVAAMEPSLSCATHTATAAHTAHAVVTPELTPVEMPSSEELRVAPNVPLLKKRLKDGPATAALERFMLPQKNTGIRLTTNSHHHHDEGDFAHFSFDEPQHYHSDDSHSSSWSKQDSDESLPFPDTTAVLPPPQDVDDGNDRRPRTVSFTTSRMSSQASVSDSSWSSRTTTSGGGGSVSTDSSLLSMLSSFTLEPTKKTKISIPTVTEAGTTTM
mmetsp:Transcript_6162/g.9611  ORF Transcript_6162/g.9611 Transcript_6162/m.9611 type:complete len:319 (+) Transcript_6162:202-1158(+)|eukprot:CAMPEP_0201730874 /NCGR_PEP_ID=MMETSP0593-20130828/23824_1 /ASSEMBLY_ACC=CAM_ASM_000672 /TAXON_ID=267983 /ORGANISM="Skeletonema japonicum, Strain CCMP2506" /LENGTH=318 /DNA_ID=CAMNT_0048223527 /DNA_START=160 /DNA_END=1116 /DNA_ORIENTATION=+